MTISREAFDKGLSPLEDRIVSVLKAHAERAYTADALSKELGIDMSSVLGALSFSVSLMGLAGKGLIQSKVIGGKTYYTSTGRGS